MSRKEYQDDVTIKRGIESIESANIEIGNLNINDLQEIYNQFILEFDKDRNFVRRMKLICDIYFQYPTFYIQYANSPLQTIIPIEYQNYINLLGFEKIRALSYQESTIVEYLKSKEINENKNIDFSSVFSIGSKYTTKQIKSLLADYYITNSISRTPKASDLEEYFNLKPVKIKNESGKWEHGFLILSKKEGVD